MIADVHCLDTAAGACPAWWRSDTIRTLVSIVVSGPVGRIGGSEDSREPGINGVTWSCIWWHADVSHTVPARELVRLTANSSDGVSSPIWFVFDSSILDDPRNCSLSLHDLTSCFCPDCLQQRLVVYRATIQVCNKSTDIYFRTCFQIVNKLINALCSLTLACEVVFCFKKK